LIAVGNSTFKAHQITSVNSIAVDNFAFKAYHITSLGSYQELIAV